MVAAHLACTPPYLLATGERKRMDLFSLSACNIFMSWVTLTFTVSLGETLNRTPITRQTYYTSILCVPSPMSSVFIQSSSSYSSLHPRGRRSHNPEFALWIIQRQPHLTAGSVSRYTYITDRNRPWLELASTARVFTESPPPPSSSSSSTLGFFAKTPRRTLIRCRISASALWAYSKGELLQRQS